MDPISAVDNADLAAAAQATGAYAMQQDATSVPPPAAQPETVRDTDVGRNIDLYA